MLDKVFSTSTEYFQNTSKLLTERTALKSVKATTQEKQLKAADSNPQQHHEYYFFPWQLI